MTRHSPGDAVKIRRPAAVRLELVLRGIERRVAARAGVDALLGHVLVVFASVWRFGSLLSQHAELF